MSCLHTISKSPDAELLGSCVSLLRPGDAILFLEDGVYHCATGELLDELAAQLKLYCLADDLEARGLTALASDVIEPVGYAEFVALAAAHDRVISWF